MTLAIGGSTPSSQMASGALWVDVRDYGANADNGVTDNSEPIQAAIDDLISKMIYPASFKGTIFVPSAPLPYGVAKTIWVDGQNIEIQGEGWGSNVAMTNRHTTFLFGVRRTEFQTVNGVQTPLNIDASNRPDLFGKLDASVVSSPGSMWGIRTNGNSYVQFQASPIASGPSSSANQYSCDYWSESPQVTIEFCIEPPDGQQFPVGVPLLGMGLDEFEPAPFTVATWDTPTKIIVMFRTADIGAGESEPNRYFGFDLGSAVPPFRIAIQFDLVNAVCSAFVNGVQVEFTYTANMSPSSTPAFAANTGLAFVANEKYPFMIGADNVHGPLYNMTGIDLRLYGLRISKTLRYQTNGAGKPQIRTDVPNVAITDAYAYFGNDAFTICFVRGTDNPANSGRVVTVSHGAASAAGPSSGIFMHTPNSGGISGNAIRDLQVVSGAGYGVAIGLGGVLEMTIRNVKATNGFGAVGSFNMYASYTIYIDNCWFEGFDSCYHGFTQLAIGRNIVCGRAGRDAIRHVGGSGHWENVFVAFPDPNTQTVVRILTEQYGGNFMFTNLNVDFEGESVGLAMIYCEAIAESSGTSLVLRDIILGTVGESSSLVMLKDIAPLGGEFNRCWLDIDNIQAFTSDYMAAVDIDGPLWYGKVEGVALTGPRFVHRQLWGKQSNILVREFVFTAPPRIYPWYAGAHVLEVRSPVDGQFAEWRCVTTGCYGTSTPPAWVGLNRISLSPTALAAYFISHCYMTADLTTH